MNTIRTYLDNMFLTLPQTPETLRAKEELYSMMEDKYNELKEAGKSENEAIGTVIAEFGNLEELVDSLHLKHHTDFQEENARTVSSDEAEEYLQCSKQNAIRVALGVMLCIFSPVPLIGLAGACEYLGIFSEAMAALVGLLLLFLLVTAAVVLFISCGTNMKRFEYLKTETFHMDFGTISYLKELHSQFLSGFTAEISIGVGLCILCAVPVIASALLFEEQEMLIIGCVCLLFLMVGAGVFLLVHAGMQYSSYQVLFQEGDYTPKKKQNPLLASIVSALYGCYWMVVTLIYLGSSFLFGNWHISWIIWIVAGILQPVFGTIVKAVQNGR